MTSVEGIPLDRFCLDERVYERSKLWSSFMKRTSERAYEDNEEYDFDLIEKVFEDNEKEIDDESDSSDKSVNLIIEGEVNEGSEEAFNTSVLQLRTFSNCLELAAKQRCAKFANNKLDGKIKSRLEKTSEENNKMKCDDIQDIVNQTLPLFVERERRWEESGMINVLNTFDEKFIEEKVGTWWQNNIGTHNAPYIIPSLICTQRDEHLPKNGFCPTAKFSYTKYRGCAPDSEESLHSIETARYIRSNRKPRNGPTMNIKTYRLMQSKRIALREKYSFSEDEEFEHQQRRSRHIHNQNLIQKCPITNSHYPRKSKCDISLETTDCSQQQIRRRRKNLNKRRVRTTKSENKSFVANSYRQWRRQRKTLVYSAILRSKSSKTYKYDLDDRPRRRVSECNCYDKDLLCNETKYLADTSTEKWFVENSFVLL